MGETASAASFGTLGERITFQPFMGIEISFFIQKSGTKLGEYETRRKEF